VNSIFSRFEFSDTTRSRSGVIPLSLVHIETKQSFIVG